MNLIAIIPPGVTELTVNGLHQWDLGRKLEIHSADLQGIVEVHFACGGMAEAVVRSCSSQGGVVEAAIPNQCLEQTGPITAWVFMTEGSYGETLKTITLPIIARVKPQSGSSIPEEASDRYTEAVAEMNRLVGAAEETVEAVEQMADQMTDQVTERVRGQVDERVAEQVAAQMEQQVKNATDNIYKALGDQNGETIVYSAYRAEKAKNATGAEKAKTAEDGTNLSEKLNLVGDGYKLLNYFDSNTAIGTVVPGIVSFLVRRSGVTAASVIVDLNGDQRVTSPMLNVCIPESTTFPGATLGAVVQYALFLKKHQ